MALARACVRVYAHVLVPPNNLYYTHTYMNEYLVKAKLRDPPHGPQRHTAHTATQHQHPRSPQWHTAHTAHAATARTVATPSPL